MAAMLVQRKNAWKVPGATIKTIVCIKSFYANWPGTVLAAPEFSFIDCHVLPG